MIKVLYKQSLTLLTETVIPLEIIQVNYFSNLPVLAEKKNLFLISTAPPKKTSFFFELVKHFQPAPLWSLENFANSDTPPGEAEKISKYRKLHILI